MTKGNDVVVLLARGELVQAEILKGSKAGGLFTKYLVGEIRADFLDLDELADIATCCRRPALSPAGYLIDARASGCGPVGRGQRVA